MQKMIEQAGPSRQLFETVNFAFMKNFDFWLPAACGGAALEANITVVFLLMSFT